MTLPVLQSNLLGGVSGVRHAFLTRQGGVSQGVYESLNVGRGSRDDPASVAENRRRAAAWFGRAPQDLSTCYQIHSATALTAEAGWGDLRSEGDAVVSRAPGVVCGALAADCAPVLLADPVARVVGAAHAGWRGALSGIVGSTVEAMRALGGEPGRMVAAVGPCIGPSSYEVGEDFLQQFETIDRASGRFFSPGVSPDKRLFDLPGYVLSRLVAAGVTRAEWVGHDTCAEEDLFFSNRRATKRGEEDYGRLLSAIMLA